MKPTLACSVANAEARRHVHQAAALHGVALKDIDMPLKGPSRKRPDWAGLVYDLAPWDPTATQAVHQARRDYPTLPILLVVPPHEAAAELLIQCGTLPCVHGVLHGSEDIADKVKEAMHVLLADAPAAAVRNVVLALLPGLPDLIGHYVECVVDELRQRRQGVRVANVLRFLPLSPRATERAFANAGLPNPKRVNDWLTLLLIALAAERGGMTLGMAARRFGYNPNEFYRLRQRVLPPGVRDLPARATQAFDITLLAFAETCGVSRDRAMAALALDPSGRHQAQA